MCVLGGEQIKFGLGKISLAAECRTIRVGRGQKLGNHLETLHLSREGSLGQNWDGSWTRDKGNGRKM